ncbi:MAG: hypothetical protein WA126_04210 [Thermodesulfovibrionales bacterium]
MAKGRKRKDSAGENVEAYKYETETRKNAVPAEPSSYDTSKPKHKRYDYDPHLNPQLIWSGGKDTSFEIPTVSLHIHERISP